MANFVRTVSNNAKVEEVVVYNKYHDTGTLKALCDLMKFIPSLKSLGLYKIDQPQLIGSDAKAIFNVLEETIRWRSMVLHLLAVILWREKLCKSW